MLTIRLQRSGKKNKPEFRIILAEKTSAANKKFTEILGHYNPHTKVFGIKEDRLKYWMDQHVTLSPTVHNLFVTKAILEGVTKVKAFTIPKKPVEPEAPAAPAATTDTTDTPAVEGVVAETPVEPVVETPVETPIEVASEPNPEPVVETK